MPDHSDHSHAQHQRRFWEHHLEMKELKWLLAGLDYMRAHGPIRYRFAS